MSAITDTGNTPITYVYFQLQESTDGPVFTVRAPGGAGRFLAADDNAFLRVLGRRAGTSDAFADLASAPLSLSWADPADVEVKTHANAVTVLEQPMVTVRSTKNP
jgi:ribonuclease HI